MQDRSRQFDEIFLQRTAGPYKGVKSADGGRSGFGPKAAVYAIKASKLVRRCLAGIPDYFSRR